MTVTLAPAAEVDARLAFATRIAEAGGRRLLAVRGSGRWTDPDMLGDVGDQAADGYLQGALQARWPDGRDGPFGTVHQRVVAPGAGGR